MQNRLPSRGPPGQTQGPATGQIDGMVMIDDDLGMSSAAFPDLPGMGSAPGSGPSSRAVGRQLPLPQGASSNVQQCAETAPL